MSSAHPQNQAPTTGSMGLQPDHIRGLMAALVVVVCWSGFNIVSRFGAKGIFTPFDLAAMRFGVSGLIMLPFFIRLIPVRDYPKYMAISLFGGLGYGLCVYSGFSFAPSAHAGVFVNGGIPFWTVILVGVLAGFKLPGHTLMALLISTCGLVLIAFDSLVNHQMAGQWRGDLLYLAAALSWAIFGVLIRRWQIKPLYAVCGIATFALIIYMPIYAIWLPKTIASAGWGDIILQGVYQGIVAALVAAGMFSYATHKIGSCEASMMLALVPAFSAIGGYFILGEDLSWAVILGIVIVSFGALLGAIPTNPVAFLLGRTNLPGVPPAASTNSKES